MVDDVVVVAVAFAVAVGMCGLWACVMCVNVCTNMCASSYARVRMCVCMYRTSECGCACKCMCVCVHGRKGVNLRYTDVCMYLCVCMYACGCYLCMYILCIRVNI